MKDLIYYILGLASIVALSLIALSIGRYEISLHDMWLLLQGNGDALHKQILVEFRLPRILLAIIMGIGLALSGAAFQSLFKNPLASPDILGVTSGASFGAVVALLLGLGSIFVAIFGFVFGVGALILVVLISYDKHMPYNTITMILAGIIISALFQSLISLVKYLADPQDTLPAITYWLLGSLESSFTPQMLYGVLAIAFGSGVIFMLRWKLNLLALNDDEARTLGIALNSIRTIVILSATVIVVCSVMLCGIIGWVGLLVPHIARLLVGSENSRVIPASALIGGGFLLIVDTISRTIGSEQIPISILTAILGAPFFMYILRKNKGVRL